MAERLAVYSTLLGAYRPYLIDTLAARGIEVTVALEQSIGDGETWLATELEELARIPFPDQRRGPLELFQAAMRFPTDALSAEGHPAVERDEVARRALPGDVYDLAPASTRSLGEEAWMAHLEWGAAKAAALRHD